MRILVVVALAGFCGDFWAGPACGQPKGPPIKINQVRVGFRSYVADEAPGRFKVGLWTPVAVDVEAGPLGLSNAELVIETADSENVATRYTVPIGTLGKNEPRTILTYTKPGNSEGRFVFSVRINDRDIINPLSTSQAPLRLPERLYVTLGNRVDALQKALESLRPAKVAPESRDTFPRQAGFEIDVKRLPTLALGYDAVDLLFLTTGDRKLLNELARDAARLKAMAGWVRQGGRLVVSCSWANQQDVSNLLRAPAWQPPLPVTPPADAREQAVKRLLGIEAWANITEKPFPASGQKPVPIALLQPPGTQYPEWEVKAETDDGRPLLTSMPYGRGRIVFLAFDLDKGPFTVWKGRDQFLKALVERLEPKVPPNIAAEEQVMFEGGRGSQDLTSQLQITLDQFDVPIIPFGWVALFIIVYILIIGPLDYLILKRVVKRLEGTWITFPAVVLVVSVAAYFTAYAVKGKELKVNKVDLVDFDLRTDLDEKFQPRKAYAYGQSWFTIMSPRIQSYTIGIEPAVAGWWGKKEGPESAEVVSWLGRPELDGPGAMGRPRGQGWSQRAYSYEPDATGLSGVPIPVWTTKSFTASWESPLPKVPLRADLVYHLNKERRITGKIQSFLPVDLHDVWIFYRDKCYPLARPLRGGKGGGAAQEITLSSLPPGIQGQDLQNWPSRSSPEEQQVGVAKDWDEDWDGRPIRQARYAPTSLIKEILFHEQVDSGANRRNQSLLRLDLSWRLPRERHSQPRDTLRDVIIYGRLAHAAGDAEALTRTETLPTYLWLGDVPGPNRTRPGLTGNMTQDTYIRLILPARPAQ